MESVFRCPRRGPAYRIVAALGAALLLGALFWLLSPLAHAQTPGVEIHNANLTLDESTPESYNNYAIKLTSEPTANVTITATSPNVAQVELQRPGTTAWGGTVTLTFTSSNWDEQQWVRVRRGDTSRVNDKIDQPNVTYEITHLASSMDATYNGISIGTVAANLIDDDRTLVSLSGDSHTIEEGQTKTITVKLSRALVAGEELTVGIWYGSPDPHIFVGVHYTTVCESATLVTCSRDGTLNAVRFITFTGGANAAQQVKLTLTALVKPIPATKRVIVRPHPLNRQSGVNLGGGAVSGGQVSFLVVPGTVWLRLIPSWLWPEHKRRTLTIFGPQGRGAYTFKLCFAGTATPGDHEADPPGVYDSDKPPGDYTLIHAGTGTEVPIGQDNCVQITFAAGTTASKYYIEPVDDLWQEADESIIVRLASDNTPDSIVLSTHAVSTIIRNNDFDGNTRVSFTTPHLEQTNVEEGGTVTAELVLNRTRSHEFTVKVVGLPLGPRRTLATAGVDFDAGAFEVTFPANTLRQTFTVQTHEDNIYEQDERFILKMVTSDFPDWLYAEEVSNRTVVIEDDDARVGFPLRNYLVAEGSSIQLPIKVESNRKSDFDLTVTFAAGSAKANDLTGGFAIRTVSVPDGATSVKIPIIPEKDMLGEGNETFTITLSTTDSDIVFTRRTTTVTIVDDDPRPTVQFVEATASADEGDTHTVTLKLKPPSKADLMLSYTVGGRATAGSDYDALSGTVMVPAETMPKAKESIATIEIQITDDMVQDGRMDETVVLTLTGGEGYAVGAKNTHTLSIKDSDPVPVASFASSAQSAGEGSGTRNVQLNLKPAPDADLTLTYTIGGTATADTDYTALSGTVRVAAGATTATIPVVISDDLVTESNKTIVLTLEGSDNRYEAGNPSTHTLTIVDDDAVTTEASFDIAKQTVDEAAGTVEVQVNFLPVPKTDITLTYTVGGTATSADYSIASSGTVTVNAGDRTANISVAITDDIDLDKLEIVVLTLTGGSGYLLGGTTTHTLSITDNEPLSEVNFWDSGIIVLPEGSGKTNIMVTLDPPPIQNITVSYTVEGCGWPNATPGKDANALTGSLSVSANQARASIPLTLVDDKLVEGGESLCLKLQDSQTYEVGRGNLVQVNIVDNEGTPPAQPQVWFELRAVPVENVMGRTYQFVVHAWPAPKSTITVPVVHGGVATQADYSFTSITFNADQTRTTGILTTFGKRTSVERGFNLTLQDGYGYTLRTDRHWLSVLLLGSDAETATQPVVSFASDAQSVDEGVGTSNVRINLDPAPSEELILFAQFGKGSTAERRGVDFESVRWYHGFDITVPAGQTTHEFPVTIVDDSLVEGDETLILELKCNRYRDNVPLCKTGKPSVHTLTIIDNDPATTGPTPEVSFASASQTVREDIGTVDVTMNLNPAPNSALTLSYSVAGTADGGMDYTLLSGTVSVAANAKTVTIPVAITDDSDMEGEETIVLTLTTGTGYTPGTSSVHTLTIAGSDMPIVVSFATAASTVTEDWGTQDVVVNLDPAPTTDTSVKFAVSDSSSAISGDDYVGLPTTVPVSAGTTTATIPVEIKEDTQSEDAETIVITIVPFTGQLLGSQTTHTVTITANDPPPVVSFATDASTAREVNGTHDVTINLSPVPQKGITLNYMVAGTADSPADYAALSGTVSVGALASTVTIRVAIMNDSVEDSGETVVLTLTAGTGYTLGAQLVHTLTIVNKEDDPQTEQQQAYTPPASLVVDVRSYIAEANRSDQHVKRWKRVLIGLGVESYPGLTSMTSAKAQTFADRGWTRWDPVVTELAKAEAASQPQQPQQQQQSPPPPTPPATPQLSITGGAGVSEGEDAVFTITANPAPTSQIAVLVDVSQVGDTSVAGAKVVLIEANSTSATLFVSTIDDAVDEPDGSVTATLQAGTGYNVGATSSATIVVADNDAAVVEPDPALVADIEARIELTAKNGDKQSNKIWRRALAAVNGDPPPDGERKLTASEAQNRADSHGNGGRQELAALWQRIADAVRRRTTAAE